MTGQTLKLTPHESVTVRESTPDVLEVEVLLEADKPPPPHFHPAQEEHFQVIEGELQARVDAEERTLRAGDTLSIPRGAAHQMWNAGAAPTRATWRTAPRLRTEEWFSELDSLQRAGRVGRSGMPGVLTLAPLLMEYRDVFRPALKPRPVIHAALALLSVVGRLTGHRPQRA